MRMNIVVFIVMVTLSGGIVFSAVDYKGGNHTEDFNSLKGTGSKINWSDDKTLDGWHASQSVYQANDGTSKRGALKSYGAKDNKDRALGSMASGTSGNISYGLCLTNNTGKAINRGRTRSVVNVPDTP